MINLERAIAELESRLGSVEDLQTLAGFIGVLNAALLESKREIRRAALLRLKARVEHVAEALYRMQGVVGNRIGVIREELNRAS